MFTDGWFTDIFGNPIARALNIRFSSKDLPPLLTLPTAPVILERDDSRLPFQVRNLENLTARLHSFASAEDFADALELGRKEDVSEYDVQTATRLTLSQQKLATNRKTMIDAELEGKPGLFAVEVSADGTGSEAGGHINDSVLVQRTDLAVTSKVFADKVFVWVTRLHDAVPVQDAKVKIYAGGNEFSSNGVTDADGTVTLDAPGLTAGTGLKRNIAVIAEKEGDIAVSRLVGPELSQPWQFGLKGEVEGFAQLPAAIFTDRGACRPGETVHLGVIVGKNIAQASDRVELEIRDPRGQQAAKQTLEVDGFGNATFDLKTKEASAVGEYLAQVSIGAYLATHSFRVEESRVPSFQVSVSTEQETWKRGEDAEAVISAKYLHGGKLGGRELKWHVLRQPVPFAPAAFPRYVFTLGDPASLGGNLLSGTDRLDGEGQFVVNFRADHPSLTKDAAFYGLGLTLGNGEVSLLELAQAYAIFARSGLSCRVTPFARAMRYAPRRIFSEEIAFLISDILSDESLRIRAFGAANPLLLGFPMAIKTGISANWRDNWVAGYTPDYTNATKNLVPHSNYYQKKVAG